MKIILIAWSLLLCSCAVQPQNDPFILNDRFKSVQYSNKAIAQLQRTFVFDFGLPKRLNLSFNVNIEEGLPLDTVILKTDNSNTLLKIKKIITTEQETEMKQSFYNNAANSTLSNNPTTTSIIVNPDGTHSVMYTSGGIGTVVNPDGTHSTVHTNGNVSVIVHPNGTHSITHNNGNISTIVHPNGTHSVQYHSEGDSKLLHLVQPQLTDNNNVNNYINHSSIELTQYCKIEIEDEMLTKIAKSFLIKFEIKLSNQNILIDLTKKQVKQLKKYINAIQH